MSNVNDLAQKQRAIFGAVVRTLYAAENPEQTIDSFRMSILHTLLDSIEENIIGDMIEGDILMSIDRWAEQEHALHNVKDIIKNKNI